MEKENCDFVFSKNKNKWLFYIYPLGTFGVLCIYNLNFLSIGFVGKFSCFIIIPAILPIEVFMRNLAWLYIMPEPSFL